jgi:putative nucleotidyltransferase with HDIG domain
MDAPGEDRPSLRRRIRRAWDAAQLWLILVAGLVGAVLALSIGVLQGDSALLLDAGDVAGQDILAPYGLTYQSEVLTEQAAEAAEAEVLDVYDPPNSAIARDQIERLTAALDFIGSVRADAFATSDQRLQDLLAMEDVQLTPASAQEILNLPATRWEAVRLESLAALEQVMRGEIREDRLEDARRGLPTLVSISMAEDQAQLVVELVSAFIVPNAIFNEAETELAREQARESVGTVSRSFAQGETIVSRGEVVEELEIEALLAFELLEAPNRLLEISLRALLVTAVGGLVALYAYRAQPQFVQSTRLVAITTLLFVLSTLTLQFVVPGQPLLPYFFPAATMPILMAILVGPGMGVMSALAIGAVAGFLGARGLEIGLYYMLSGIMGALMIGRAERLSIFAWAGLAADLAAVAVVVIFRIPDPATDPLGKAQIIGGALTTGLFSASLAFGLLIMIGNLLGITTNLQLIELSRPDHPLLQLLLRSAPGTYQHSLQVANLGEQAARAIGANALLTRVGALYHDVGKSQRPQFFIENQLSGQNIHDQLDPATSASMILAHVTDGIELARKHRLPKVVADFIPEHHGTMMTSFQYHAALEAAGDSEIDPRDFTYPGPRPRSRETAILMLSDGVEAKIRADNPEDEASLEATVEWVIDDRLAKNQLARTDLTLKDLDTIRRSFITTLRSIYHPRIRYPSPETDAEQPPEPIENSKRKSSMPASEKVSEPKES